MNVVQAAYFLCLAIVWLLYRFAPTPRLRPLFLLAASYGFYLTWTPAWLVVLVLSSLVNFALGAWLRRNPALPRLVIGLSFNVLLLLLFRYVGPMFHWRGSWANWLLPVGISFWTFQAISYLLDVYAGEELDPSLPEFLLYLSFWPVVLSGPICRIREVVPQFRMALTPRWNDVAYGCRRILTGLFMKVVLAQVLASGLQPGEGTTFGFDELPGGWGGFDVWCLGIGYGLQLFFDFAGYSNIVIGSAALFGLRLPENFDRPFLSASVSQFWTRWHISLSFWIRDYLFVPLASWRRGFAWRQLSLLIAMGGFGLWHGLTWLFLIWGLYQGALLVAHRLLQWTEKRVGVEIPALPARFFGWAVTFGSVSLGWILFRARTLATALAMLRVVVLPGSYRHLALRPNFYLMVTAVLVCYFGTLWLSRRVEETSQSAPWHVMITVLKPLYYAALLLLISAWSREQSVFVYFQF